jgi:outer membrane protein assembly factor BamA
MRGLQFLYQIITFFFSLQAYAQVQIKVNPVDSAARSIKIQQKFGTVQALNEYVKSLPPQFLSKGYLSVSVDSFVVDSPNARLDIFLGPRYKWGGIRVDSMYLPMAQELSFPGNGRAKKSTYAADLDYRSLVLDYFENQGFPFAKVGYDSVELRGDVLWGKMVIDKGSFYKFDSIAQSGPLRMNNRFIYRYLGLKPGGPFQNAKFNKISQRLDELPFAEQVQPWQLQMLGTGSVANIFLKNKRSNILNILLGVMPASTQTPGNAVQVTGDANILLRNSFRSGETIGINWQQIQYKSPRLNLQYNQPYLFGSKAGVDFFFELFRKDTQFVNLNLRLGMPYEFSLTKAGKILFQIQQTNVTTIDTQFVLQNQQLPDLAATVANSLGIEYAVNNTNYRLNPRKGTELGFYLVGGTKRITQSAEISNLKDPSNPGGNFSYLYDSLQLNTYQIRLKANAAGYVPLGRFTVLKLGVSAATYESGNYFRNELFQVGGFKLLRGFDEESIFARRYAVLTTELRLISGKNAYFFGFADGGYAQYKDPSQQFGNTYLGTGLGMVLETKNSLINISWAIGKRNDLPLDLRQSKIHLGLINFF